MQALWVITITTPSQAGNVQGVGDIPVEISVYALAAFFALMFCNQPVLFTRGSAFTLTALLSGVEAQTPAPLGKPGVPHTFTIGDADFLLGGQRLVTEAESESGVPVLSKIPILNRFFTNRVITKSEQTLLILVKPTVLIQNEEEERNFPGLSDSVRLPFGGG